MGGKSTPPPPDYRAAAQAQAQSSKEVTNMQTYANRPDQVTPWGRTSWGTEAFIDPATGQEVTKWSQNTSLDPRLQDALDKQIAVQRAKSGLAYGMQGRMADEYANKMDWSGFQDFGQSPEQRYVTPENIQRGLDYSGLDPLNSPDRYRQESIDAAYGQATSRLDPAFEQQKGDLEARLMAQGLRPGDEAYDREMDNFSRRKVDAYNQAQFSAIGQGAADASRMYGMEAARRGQLAGEIGQQGAFANQAAAMSFGQGAAAAGQNYGQDVTTANYQTRLRQQQIAEQLQQRGFSLNEINAILTGQQVGMPSMPSFSPAARSEAAQYNRAAENQWGAELDRFNAQQGGMQMLLGGATDLTGAVNGFKFSDRRLKRDIMKIGNLDSGLSLYVFEYIWGSRAIGVMADEVLRLFPSAVAVHPSGYLMVNYGEIG